MSKQSRIQLSPRLRSGVGRATTSYTLLRYGTTLCIVIAAGLSINTFRMYVSQANGNEEATNSPQVLGISSTQEESTQKQKGSEFETYVVKKGETLFNIAQTKGVSWTLLATLNNIESPFTVNPGDEIKIPKL